MAYTFSQYHYKSALVLIIIIKLNICIFVKRTEWIIYNLLFEFVFIKFQLINEKIISEDMFSCFTRCGVLAWHGEHSNIYKRFSIYKYIPKPSGTKITARRGMWGLYIFINVHKYNPKSNNHESQQFEGQVPPFLFISTWINLHKCLEP